MSVTHFMGAAFAHSRASYPQHYQDWVSISYKIGPLLPASKLLVTVQRVGEMDMLLRCMEDDFLKMQKQPEAGDPFMINHQIMLSEAWISAVYEFMRLLSERKLKSGADFVELAHHLRLLRVPMEKHEIAADRNLKEPLPMMRFPPREDDEPYYYTPGDPMRSHAMPTNVSNRGSIMWHVIDLKLKESYWLERKEIADRLMNVWLPKEAKSNVA